MRKLKGGNSCVTCGVAVAAATFAVARPAQAAFTLVDDFNRADNVQVAGWDEVDGDPNYDGMGVQSSLVNNQMHIYSNAAIDYEADIRASNHGAGATAINSSVKTIFYQMTLTNAQTAPANNWNAGFALNTTRYAAAHSSDLFSVYANGTGSSIPVVANSGNMEANNPIATTGSMTVGTQYNFWLVFDTGTLSVYMNTGAANATPADLIVSNVAFGTTAPQSIVAYGNALNFAANNAGFGNGANGSNSFDIDNVYIETAANLTNPVPEPASLGLLTLAGAGLLLPRRRRA